MTETAAATVATLLYAVGVVLLFGVRSWQQKRATGSAGFNGFTADRGPAARIANLSFAAAVVAGLISPALVLAGLLPVLKFGSACCGPAWCSRSPALGLAVLGATDHGPVVANRRQPRGADRPHHPRGGLAGARGRT